MLRRFCTLLAIVMAFGVAFGALGARPAEAQGQPTCALVFLVEPDSPTPTPTVTDDDDDDDDDTIVGSDEAVAANNCADAHAYPGPFTNVPAVPASPYSPPVGLSTSPQPSVVSVTTTTATTTAIVTGNDLAHSGTETFVLAYLGTGFLAFGAFAMGIRRRSPND